MTRLDRGTRGPHHDAFSILRMAGERSGVRYLNDLAHARVVTDI